MADQQQIAALRQAQAAGEPIGSIVVRYNTRNCRARRAGVADARRKPLEELPEIARRPIGYWGLALGTAVGVPLAAVESRITAAVFALLGHESLTGAAGNVTVPLQFLLQRDDEHVERPGHTLFDAFGSTEKTAARQPRRAS